MGKIDVTQIEGYAEMSAEEKVKALEELETPEPDYTGYVKKETFDKTASELAAKKRELNQKLSEDEVAKQQEAEERKALEEKYEALLRESTISKNKAKLLGLGYEDKLADETAEAMADGDLDKFFKNHKKHLDNFEKSIKAEVLKNTPRPEGEGDKNNVMTLDNFRKMSAEERLKYSTEHPEEYREMYQNDNGGKE